MSTFLDRNEKALARERFDIPFDPEFTSGARNAVNVCLRVQPDEKVCMITDEATAEIAAAIARELMLLALNTTCGSSKTWRNGR